MSQFFWFFATFDVVVSIGIEVWVCTDRAQNLKADHLACLAIGQRKDTRLVCAIVWIFLLCDGYCGAAAASTASSSSSASARTTAATSSD